MRDGDGFGPQDLNAHISVSRETVEKLEWLVDALGLWRRSINLIGPREYEGVWRRHVLDSIQLARHVPAKGAIVDMGSGGGFPALVLAICMAPDGQCVHMVESVGKKCAYLRHVVRSLSLNAEIHHMRIQNFQLSNVGCITARAFAPLCDLLSHSAPWTSQGAMALFPKGENWQEELTLAQNCWRFAYEAIPSLTHADGVILKISEVSRVGP